MTTIMTTTTRAGTPVTIKDKATGEKIRGTVLTVDHETEPIEITIGPNEAGIPPDRYRRFAPGRTSVTITVAVNGSAFAAIRWREVRVKDKATGRKMRGMVTGVTVTGDGALAKTTVTIDVDPR